MRGCFPILGRYLRVVWWVSRAARIYGCYIIMFVQIKVFSLLYEFLPICNFFNGNNFGFFVYLWKFIRSSD